MTKNAKFYVKKLEMTCWYCDGKSDGVLVFLNGDEIASCKACFLKNTRRTTKEVVNASPYPLMRPDTKNFDAEHKGKVEENSAKIGGCA